MSQASQGSHSLNDNQSLDLDRALDWLHDSSADGNLSRYHFSIDDMQIWNEDPNDWYFSLPADPPASSLSRQDVVQMRLQSPSFGAMEPPPNRNTIEDQQQEVIVVSDNSSSLPDATDACEEPAVRNQRDRSRSRSRPRRNRSGSRSRSPRRRRQARQRDETTISKPIFTSFKDCFRQCDAVDFTNYFKVRPYNLNHRPLFHFYEVVLVVNHQDRQNPGTYDRFLEYMESLYNTIMSYGLNAYPATNSRREVYLKYLNRVYAMLRDTGSIEHKLETLYATRHIKENVKSKIADFKDRLHLN